MVPTERDRQRERVFLLFPSQSYFLFFLETEKEGEPKISTRKKEAYLHSIAKGRFKRKNVMTFCEGRGLGNENTGHSGRKGV